MTNKPTNTPVLSAEEKRNEILKNNINNHWKDDKFFDSIKPTLQWAHNSMEEYAQPLQEENQQLKERIKELFKEIIDANIDWRKLLKELRAKEEMLEEMDKHLDLFIKKTNYLQGNLIEKLVKDANETRVKYLNQKDNTNK